MEDSATPEMYCECFYLDSFIEDVLPVMSSRDARRMTRKAAIFAPFAISSSSNHSQERLQHCGSLRIRAL